MKILDLDRVFKEAKKVKYIWPWEEAKIRKSIPSCVMILAPNLCHCKNHQMAKMVSNLFIVLTDLKTSLYKPTRDNYSEFGRRFDPVLNFDGEPELKLKLREYLTYHMLKDDMNDKEEDRKNGRYNPFNDKSLYKNTQFTMSAKANEELTRLEKAFPEVVTSGFWWP